jgi:hypothetical protein
MHDCAKMQLKYLNFKKIKNACFMLELYWKMHFDFRINGLKSGKWVDQNAIRERLFWSRWKRTRWKEWVKFFYKTGSQIITKTTESAQHGNRISINLAGNEIMRVTWILMANATLRPFQFIIAEDHDHGESLNNYCVWTDIFAGIIPSTS